jgi:hypothetical protein
MENKANVNIEELVALYNKLRQKRSELEKMATEIKSSEENVKAQLLMALDMFGLTSIKSNNTTISRTSTIRPEIIDHAALQEVMYKLMTEARAEGRPLQDGLLLQRTVAKNSVLAYIREQAGLSESDELDVSNPKVAEIAKSIGLNLRVVTDLSIRKS